MADLDTLRPEVMEAAAKLDDFDSAFGTGGHWQIIRAELLRLAADRRRADVIRDSYMTQLTQTQLERGDAIQRAEKAEAELAALMKKCTCSRRSVSSPIGCRVCNPQLEIADLESKLATSEAELAALKARIAVAPIVDIANIGDPFIVLPDHLTVPNSMKGQRVRLVVEE